MILVKKITTSDVINKDIKELVISSDVVAHVQTENPLEHALLVLIKTGYSAVPVLDSSSRLRGIISKTIILDFILGIERIEFEKLSEHKVEEVMRCDVPLIRENDDFLNALKLSINHPFLCYEDHNGYFGGILPRSSLLKFLNHYLRDRSHDAVSLSKD